MGRVTKPCILVFALACAGCAHLTWKAYPGPERPLEEIAVVLAEDAFVSAVDGQCVHGKEVWTRQCITSRATTPEVHLLPGEHVIYVRYLRSEADGYGSSIEYSAEWRPRYSFEAGKVYRITGTQPDGRDAPLKIVDEGTVEEMAHKLALTVDAGRSRRLGGRAVVPSNKWKELAARKEARGAGAATVVEPPAPHVQAATKDVSGKPASGAAGTADGPRPGRPATREKPEERVGPMLIKGRDYQESATGNPVVRLEVFSLHQSSGWQVQSSGSGFFVTRDGYLLTNAHVVHPMVENEGCRIQSVGVRINQGQDDEHFVTGTIVAYDHAADLAVVKVSGVRNRPVLQLRAPGTLQPGSRVRAQGYPLGGPYEETRGTVIGVLSAEPPRRPTGVVLGSAPVQPGSSGGPVLDEGGKVVGVVVALSDTKFLRAFKRVQDSAADTLAQRTEASARASETMRAPGDEEDSGAHLGTLVRKRATSKEPAGQPWILDEVSKNPNKTHAIDIADVHRLLEQWHIPISE